MKLWSGRFSKSTDQAVDHFNSSITFDQRLYRQDIMGSIAHVTMLGQQNIISKQEAKIIKDGLLSILKDIDAGAIDFDITAEDIHMNIETLLIERIGDVGKKLHTGRSRNDQVALDMRMYVKDEIVHIDSMIQKLEKTLIKIAEKHMDTIMPGYTHLQRAQPITLAHHFMAYFEMFHRDRQRLKNVFKSTNHMPLGSGALATTTYPLDRTFVAQNLNFENITYNSIDGVSDRDFCIELLSTLSILMMHLSRFSEEIILWVSHEFRFMELDDAFSTGSSIMPQKKNPDIAELVRGKTGRVYGNLMGLLTVMKGLPLAYNKDMQEDKELIFDSIDTVKMCLPIFTQMLQTSTFSKEKMYQAASGGFTNATDAADYLVKKGIPFRTAHEVIGKLVLYCIQQDKTLEQLSLEEYQMISPHFDETIYTAISLEECVNRRNMIGGPSKEIMQKTIEENKKRLKTL
ncbi:MAG: argininosuccinate lyase [Epulopiscium sp.]|nr:argininosuccinate lyase [Candidatus Epulonipiscium sp.]